MHRRQAIGLQHGHLPLDQARFAQAFDAPQGGGRGDVGPLGQGLVAQRCVGLQQVEQAEVGFIDVDLFHII